MFPNAELRKSDVLFWIFMALSNVLFSLAALSTAVQRLEIAAKSLTT
jgi:hypothetical protein